MKKVSLLIVFISLAKIVFTQELIASYNDVYNIGDYKSSCTLENQILDVVVCDGQYSYAYHSYADCSGLNNCKGKLYQISEYDAINVYNRKPCCICWYPRSFGCAQDGNASSGGLGGGNGAGGEEVIAGMVIIAAVVVVTGAILIANEIQISPLISVFKDKSRYSDNCEVNKSIGTGFTLQFRKNFKKSGIEYGMNYINFKRELTYNVGNNIYISNIDQSFFGFHVNYVHDILTSRLLINYSVFLGPTINYINNFGYGLILGGRYKLSDRFKFDARYELSTQTNHFQIGFSFLFQKKYLWQRKK